MPADERSSQKELGRPDPEALLAAANKARSKLAFAPRFDFSGKFTHLSYIRFPPLNFGGLIGGGTGGTTGGSATGGTTGGGTTEEPVCHSIGGGKYNCTVWRTADSYTASGTKVGVLNQGINYFYCQANLGRRETSGEWTNVWWARTDDDSGNTGVYVSDVYIQGGDNDAPVPGLPVC